MPGARGLNHRRFAFFLLLDSAVGIARQCNCYSVAASGGVCARFGHGFRRRCAVLLEGTRRHGNCLMASEGGNRRLASVPAVQQPQNARAMHSS